MSLYQVQKFLFNLNRDAKVQEAFGADTSLVLADYELTSEERSALESGDIGLLYVLGANGQLLMHFAAFLGISWANYIQAMRDGIKKYGAVRDGIYAMTTALEEKVAGV